MPEIGPQRYRRILLLLTAVLAVASPHGAHRVPMANQPSLSPRSDGVADATAFLREVESHLQKYESSNATALKNTALSGRSTSVNHNKNAEGPASGHRRRGDPNTNRAIWGPGSEPLVGNTQQTFSDGEYLGKAEITYVQGGPFMTRFDTAVSDFAVPGSKCQQPDCVGPVKYTAEGGRPLNQRIDSSLMSGAVLTGDMYEDKVVVAGFRTTQSVLRISHATGLAVYNGQSQAIMGLASHLLPGSSGKLSFFENLMAGGVLAIRDGRQPEFGFFHGRAATETTALSEMMIGGRNASLFTGAVEWLPVISPPYWEVQLGGVLQSGNNVLDSSMTGSAVIDSGNGLTIVPEAALDRIFGPAAGSFPIYHKSHTFIPGLAGIAIPPLPLPSAVKAYAYKCGNPPEVKFLLGNHPYAMHPLDLNLGPIPLNGGDWVGAPGDPRFDNYKRGSTFYCLASIAGRATTNPPTKERYYLGTNFLKNWYTIIREDSMSYVGLAKAIDAPPPPSAVRDQAGPSWIGRGEANEVITIE